MKMEQTECSETLANKLHTPENIPKENLRQKGLIIPLEYIDYEQQLNIIGELEKNIAVSVAVIDHLATVEFHTAMLEKIQVLNLTL
jgi:hypothetical protein